jgi:hypothetical protein
MKIVTMSTLGTGRLVANLLASCQILGIDSDVDLYCDRSFLPYAHNFRTKLGMRAKVHDQPLLDQPLLSPCCSRVTPANWGTYEFMPFARAKLELLVELSHPARFEPFLYLDADTVFLNRLPTEWPKFLAFQSDARDFSSLESMAADSCMGCVYCPTPARSIWLLALDWMHGNAATWEPSPSVKYFDDQTAVNALLPTVHRMTATLDPALWLNGSRAFDCPQRPDVAPILVHANWRVGAKRKEAELRSRGWWFVSDESLARCGL